tara:strand:+ start:273 stop:491 length:219 start_codon:yes stop_codon:yes gene_type:complete
MTKTLIILILLFNGELLQEKFELPIEMTAHECLSFADKYREKHATYREFNDNPKNQGWYLNDGRGTISGFIC